MHVVEDGIGAAGRAQVADAGQRVHRLGQPRRAVRIARIEHGRAVHAAHHREVLQRHLRGAVGTYPRTLNPTAAAIICCSAVNTSKYRSGRVASNSSACVELPTSASTTTTR